MKLLVSVANPDEVEQALRGGTDIIDLKNPAEGSLGAPQPDTLRQVIDRVGRRRETSCAIGDVPNLPGTVSLAAAGAAAFAPDYIKLGLFGTHTTDQGLAVLKAAVKAVRLTSRTTKVIACGYGDWSLAGCLSPMNLPSISSEAKADGVLIDTINKDGRSLFDFMPLQDLKTFVRDAHGLGLITGLAGSLKEGHGELLRRCSPDVVGIRGAACSHSDRTTGVISAERITRFRSRLLGIERSPRSLP